MEQRSCVESQLFFILFWHFGHIVMFRGWVTYVSRFYVCCLCVEGHVLPTHCLHKKSLSPNVRFNYKFTPEPKAR